MNSLMIAAQALLLATEPEPCQSVAECNRQGTSEYQAGRYAQALVHFERQVDYAETAVQEFTFVDKEPTPKAIAARELALNNAALAHLKLGECLKARAWLALADAKGSATIANRTQLIKHCGAKLEQDSVVGDYWQYAGHGSWNRVTLNPGAAPQLIFDGFWMLINQGPLDQHTPTASGAETGITMTPVGNGLEGYFDGTSDDRCRLHLELTGQSIEITPQDRESCNTGGYGAHLSGRYVLVSTSPSPPYRKQTGH